jgi:orotate phosphoribosyltransferase
MQLDPAYSSTLFNSRKLRDVASKVAQVLDRIQAKHGSCHVAVTGKSGIAMAFAVSMLTDIQILTVRKDSETSHGSKFEGCGTVRRYVVLDDFVDTGDTIRRVVRDVRQFAELDGAEAPECIGFIEYYRLAGHNYQVSRVCLEDGGCVENIDYNQYIIIPPADTLLMP